MSYNDRYLDKNENIFVKILSRDLCETNKVFLKKKDFLIFELSYKNETTFTRHYLLKWVREETFIYKWLWLENGHK